MDIGGEYIVLFEVICARFGEPQAVWKRFAISLWLRGVLTGEAMGYALRRNIAISETVALKPTGTDRVVPAVFRVNRIRGVGSAAEPVARVTRVGQGETFGPM
jgi:hypothetical protein